MFINYVALLFGSHDMLLGCPRWNYHVSILAQLVTFPALVVPAWASKNFSLEWLEASWDSYPSMNFERLFLYTMVGYLTKDFLVKMDALLYLHHAVCLFGTVCWLYASCKGLTCFIFGTMILELGSASFNLWTLYRHIPCSRILYMMIMSASNLIAVLIVLRFCLFPEPPIGLKILFTTSTVGLAFMRQKVCLQGGFESKPQPPTAKTETIQTHQAICESNLRKKIRLEQGRFHHERSSPSPIA